MAHWNFPAELWYLIIDYCPREAQRAWLPVSRYFHDIASQIVFQRINVYYGAAGHDHNKPVKFYALQESRNEELFRHIAATPNFARTIRELFICWYEDCYTNATYERHSGDCDWSSDPLLPSRCAHPMNRICHRSDQGPPRPTRLRLERRNMQANASSIHRTLRSLQRAARTSYLVCGQPNTVFIMQLGLTEHYI